MSNVLAYLAAQAHAIDIPRPAISTIWFFFFKDFGTLPVPLMFDILLRTEASFSSGMISLGFTRFGGLMYFSLHFVTFISFAGSTRR